MLHLLLLLTACAPDDPEPPEAPASPDVPPFADTGGDCLGPLTSTDTWDEAVERAETSCWNSTRCEPGGTAAALMSHSTGYVWSSRYYDATGALVATRSGSDGGGVCPFDDGSHEVWDVWRGTIIRDCFGVERRTSAACLPDTPRGHLEICEEPLPEQSWPTLDELYERAETECIGFADCEGPGGPVVAVMEAPRYDDSDYHRFWVHDPSTGLRVADYKVGHGGNAACWYDVWRGEPHPGCHDLELTPSAGCGVVDLVAR